MKKLYAMLLGALLAIILIVSFDQYVSFKIEKNKDIVRNHRSYERFGSREVQKLIMDKNTLPIFGSSELVSLEDYQKNVSSFLNGDDMNIVTLGAGYYQSLSHTMELGAISDGIKSGIVALFLSPQWFTSEGISVEAFPERLSEDNLLGFLENEKISDSNKEYVLERTLMLLEGSPTQFERVERYKDSVTDNHGIDLIYTKIMSSFWKIRQKYQVYRQLDNMSQEIPQIDLKSFDFDEVMDLAEKQGEKACTNNEFGISDDYWTTYMKDIYIKGKIETQQQLYTESVEYNDLYCFLDVADELGLKVILVNIPINGRWAEYQDSHVMSITIILEILQLAMKILYWLIWRSMKMKNTF